MSSSFVQTTLFDLSSQGLDIIQSYDNQYRSVIGSDFSMILFCCFSVHVW